MRVLICAPDGPLLAKESDVDDFLSAAWSQDAAMVGIPVGRLSDDFFRLSTRLAGAVVRKFVNYRLRLAIMGDIAKWTSDSKSLRDFVREANGGHMLCFVEGLDELASRIKTRGGAGGRRGPSQPTARPTIGPHCLTTAGYPQEPGRSGCGGRRHN